MQKSDMITRFTQSSPKLARNSGCVFMIWHVTSIAKVLRAVKVHSYSKYNLYRSSMPSILHEFMKEAHVRAQTHAP